METEHHRIAFTRCLNRLNGRLGELNANQQSLTKLNAKQVAYVSGSFPSLNINMFGSGRNSSFVIQELIMLPFMFFKRNLQNLVSLRTK